MNKPDLLSLLFLTLFLFGCGFSGNNSTPITPLGESVDINIGRVIRSGEFDERADTEILPQNNCNNKSSIQFSVNRERTLEQSVNLTRKTEVGGELELAGKPLGVGAVGKIVAAIGAEYGHSSGVKIVDSGGMEFTIEAGDFPVYTVVWREKWEKGYVTIQHNDEELEVPYLYLSTARPELINVEYRNCSAGETIQEHPQTNFTQEADATLVQSGSMQTNITWEVNPVLPQPQGYTGWISTESPEDFGSGIWTKGVNVSVNENQLLLVFGGLAKLPTVGEIGTKTSCFVIASRGPLDLSLDLMSARLEVHNVDATATASEWVAQKAATLQESYPSTCGKGLDIVVGK